MDNEETPGVDNEETPGVDNEETPGVDNEETSGVDNENAPKVDKEKLKLWLGFARFVLGTVALGVFSTIISYQIQQREVELKEQELAGTFLQHALTEDVGVRRRFAEYFATVTRSKVLRNRWGEYHVLVQAEYDSTEREKINVQLALEQDSLDSIERDLLAARVVELETALRPRPPPVEQLVIEPRVYIHIRGSRSIEYNSRADDVSALLRAHDFIVPGIEVRTLEGLSELRYFRVLEREEAQVIVDILKDDGIQVQLNYVGGYESSNQLRPRHYELWFGEEI